MKPNLTQVSLAYKFIFLITSSEGSNFIRRRKNSLHSNWIIAKRVTVYETLNTENICVEITIKKRKWGIFFTDRPPNNNNLKMFLDETTQSANQLLSKIDNIIIAGAFNIDTGSKKCNKFKQFANFCYTFGGYFDK